MRSVQKIQIPFFKIKTIFFENSFFSAVIMEGNKIYVNICQSAAFNVSITLILQLIIRPDPNQLFNVDTSEGLKFLRRSRLGVRQLVDHKFRHNFQGCVNPICSCKFQPISSFTALITIAQNKPSL